MSRERTYQTEAIILRRRNWGEADRILTLFTPHRGKIRARAAGVRKPGSRKAGHLELFHRANLFLAKGRELDIVTQAETLQSFRELREDLVRSAAASYLAELLDKLAPEEADNPAAYVLLGECLAELCRAEEPAPVLRCYDVKLLECMGYRPELSRCTVGGEEIRPEDQFFSPARGGVVCPRCVQGAESPVPISLSALKVLRHIQRSPIVEAFQVPARPETLEELKQVLQTYIQYILEGPLRSRKYLEEVSRLRRGRRV